MSCESARVVAETSVIEERQPLHDTTCLVSVVVPCRNEIKHIRPFLACVFGQELGGCEVEVLIAVGMSNDGTREVLLECKERHPALHLIENPSGTVSAGLNRAINQARGQIIVRMDVHTTYASDYIVRSVETLRTTGADNVGGPALTIAEGKLAQAIAVAYHSPFACGGARFHDPDYEGYVDTVTYGCWWKATLQRIGLFDESLTRNQDDELNFRIIRRGGRIWQSRRIVSWYRPRADIASLSKQYFQYGFWKLFVIRKHGRPASYRHLVPAACLVGTFALWAVVAFGYLTGLSRLSYLSMMTWLVCAGLYAATSIVTAVIKGRTEGWVVAALLPLIFAVYHVSYGCGFLLALVSRPSATGAPPLFSEKMQEISR